VDHDGVLSADELSKDPEGAALMEALLSKLSEQLGVDKAQVKLQSIVLPSASSGLRQLSAAPQPTLPLLSRDEYYTVPSMAELAKLPAAQLTNLRGFRVGRIGYGEVRWLNEVDVSGLNLDNIVSIEHGDISVYTDKPQVDTTLEMKPTTGVGLNKPAVLVLEHIVPASGVPTKMFVEELAKSLQGAVAQHLGYDSSIGRWTFAVSAF